MGIFAKCKYSIKVINLIPLYFEIKLTDAVVEERWMVCGEAEWKSCNHGTSYEKETDCLSLSWWPGDWRGLERKIKKDAGIK